MTLVTSPVFVNTLIRFPVVASLALVLGACAGGGPYTVDRMLHPAVYDQSFSPFDTGSMADLPYEGLLYVTDRRKAGPDDKERFYVTDRSDLVHAGVAQVAFDGTDITWEEARKLALAKTGTDQFPLYVESVRDLGVLEGVLPYGQWSDLEKLAQHARADEEFVDLVNAKLATSRKKNIDIYVHGFKVVFENPVLVAAEFWHFQGYDGVFIAYAWPSSPSVFAYFKDIETAVASGGVLRGLIELLSQETDAERINIIGYSAGTRVVIDSLNRLALSYRGLDDDALREHARIGNVSLIGSDYDRWLFAQHIEDGMLRIPDMLNVYMSDDDGALRSSRRFLGHDRLGSLMDGTLVSPATREHIRGLDNLFFIDVSHAPNYDARNGHSYLRASPWVSSDLLMTTEYRLAPAQRGLVLEDDRIHWTFPDDYIERLRASIYDVDPELGQQSFGPRAESPAKGLGPGD